MQPASGFTYKELMSDDGLWMDCSEGAEGLKLGLLALREKTPKC